MVALFSLNGNAHEVDNITIRLFENEPTASVKLNTEATHITVIDQNGQETQVNSSDGSIELSSEGNRVRLKSNDTKVINDSLSLLVDENALISVDHPDLQPQKYPDKLRIAADESGLKILNKTDLETYISGVVGAEMNFDEPQALKSQAVIARTYALWLIEQSSDNRSYDLVDHTMNQVYLGVLNSGERFEEAATATEGQVLTYNDELILAAYSSTCGGATSSNKGYWDGQDLPYLNRVADGGACQLSPHFQWVFSIDSEEFYQKVGNHIGYDLRSIELGDEDGSDRWKSVYLHVADKEYPIKVSGVGFRQHVNAVFGPYALRSMRFSLERLPNKLIFDGKGMGHGIGLCQWGAKGLGLSGWGYEEILKFYYSGVELTDYQNL